MGLIQLGLPHMAMDIHLLKHCLNSKLTKHPIVSFSKSSNPACDITGGTVLLSKEPLLSILEVSRIWHSHCSYRVILEVQTSKILITQIQNGQCLGFIQTVVSPELPWCLTLLHSCTCSHLHNRHSQVLSTCSPHFLLHWDGADLESRKRSLSMSQHKGPPATSSRLCEAVLS